MAVRNLLFLLGGGSSIFDMVAEEFVPAAGGSEATIALLLAGAAGWEDFLPEYTRPWTRRGVPRYEVIVPAANGALDLDAVSAKLRAATGIFIGGGDTTVYHRLYATEPIQGIIRECYQKGGPLAGLSAGALIVPEMCAIPPEDTGDASARIVTGLGLVSDLIVGVHFSEWNALPHVLEVMAETRTRVGLGIDEAACAVLEDGQLKRVLGQSVYKIVMADFEAKAYRVTEVTCR
jgi:cyanophycinase